MEDPTLPLRGLSPVSGKPLMARFDGGMLSSDAGILVLREVEKRLGVAERLAGCIDDLGAQEHVVHGVADMIGFRLMMIAAGYEDGNDASSLRSDPAFKLVQDRLPSGRDFASQPTISRDRIETLTKKIGGGTATADRLHQKTPKIEAAGCDFWYYLTRDAARESLQFNMLSCFSGWTR